MAEPVIETAEPLALTYAAELEEVVRLAEAELGRWPWQAAPQMERLAHAHIDGRGKRLRPLLMFTLADTLGGDPGRVVPAAVGVELHHQASLILDDIQDNSAFRRGAPAVHTTCGVSNAINLAGLIRTLAYQPLRRSDSFPPDEKIVVQERIDAAAMHLYLGQSIDIGWHHGWYPDLGAYPYEQMIRWKTGALFGCAAWIAARLSGAGPAVVACAEEFGTETGALYQLADDYRDFFGSQGAPAPMEDLRAGKPTWPVIRLCHALQTSERADEADAIVRRLREGGAHTEERLVAVADDLGVREALATDLAEHARRLRERAQELAAECDAAPLKGFIGLLLGAAGAPNRPSAQ